MLTWHTWPSKHKKNPSLRGNNINFPPSDLEIFGKEVLLLWQRITKTSHVGKHPQNLEQTQCLQFQITPRVPAVLIPWILGQQEALIFQFIIQKWNKKWKERKTVAKSVLLEGCRPHGNTNHPLRNNKEQNGGEELQAESRNGKHWV